MFEKLRTIWKLGFGNLIRIALYRLEIRAGIFRLILPIGSPVKGPFFLEKNCHPIQNKHNLLIPQDVNTLFDGKIRFFSHQLIHLGLPPKWFLNFEINNILHNKLHWSLISDFGNGDIKFVWEASRFHWLTLAAQAYRVENRTEYLTLMNSWLEDWSEKNPFNQGYNWKCGQETSIRLMNLLLSSYLIGSHQRPETSFIQIVEEHCKRIIPTLHYAKAQDNNHGTSEAAGLYLAGAWLSSVCHNKKRADKWMRLGQCCLEERVAKLILDDGSFSQNSTNYHRLLLDTLSLVEFWRLKFQYPLFSKAYYLSVKAATNWLREMTDPHTGNVPNLGANDGARLLQLTNIPYSDFRPSVQLAGRLFYNLHIYSYEGADEVLRWLDISAENLPAMEKTRESKLMSKGGYATFNGESCWGIIRFPLFRFRPSHADLLHLEILDRGISLVRDGGTYSYNTEKKWLKYFSGVESHNTIQFDDDEPMPKLSRFLFGAWPHIADVSFSIEKDKVRWSGKYKDYKGRSQLRTVSLKGREWRILDEIQGFKDKAVMRWRLAPAKWKLNNNQISSSLGVFSFKAMGAKIKRLSIVDGWESYHYSEITALPVVEIEVDRACQLETFILLPEIGGHAN